MVTLLIDSRQVPVFCHVGDFGCGEGGWTPVMKIDGSKVFFIVFFFQFEFVWLILINEIKRYNYIIIITTICHVIIVIYHLSYSLLFIELFTFVSVRHLSLEWKTRLNEFSSFYREPFIIAAPTGLIETSTTLLEGRLGLTNRKPSWPSITASWNVENAYWCSCFFAKQM